MTWRRMLTRALRLPTVRALRGATTVPHDTPGAIREAVLELIEVMQRQNKLQDGEIISAIFTVTHDLSSAFPAEAAREAGWADVPLLCMSEIQVPDGMPRCLRVLVHANRDWGGSPPRHTYLRGAVTLRPDLAATLPLEELAASGQ